MSKEREEGKVACFHSSSYKARVPLHLSHRIVNTSDKMPKSRIVILFGLETILLVSP